MSSSEIDTYGVLETLPVQSSSFFIIVDSDGIIQKVSPSIEQVLGYEQKELVGKSINNCGHPDDIQCLDEMIRQLNAGQAPPTDAIKYRHKTLGGEYKWVSSVGSLVPTSNEHYIINTTEILNEGSSNNKAELVRSVDDFATVVSHDLRNPLNVASGHVELLYSTLEEENENVREHFERVMNAHKRMEDLIENLLNLAKSGQPIEDIQWVDLKELCEECRQNVSTINSEVNIEIDCEILADPSRLMQLIENLVVNSIKHGGDEVTVTIGETDSQAGFFIADDGEGISEQKRKQVFEKGFTCNSEGTGFGLAIVKEIVDAHNWRINIEDSQTGGAKFEISCVDQRSFK